MAPKPIPDVYGSVTPYLIVHNGSEAIEFYKQAFAARERMRMPGENGKVMHAELVVGDSVIMLADEFPEMKIMSPRSLGGSPVFILLYVENVDDVFQRAISLGAKQMRAVQNQFYGDRSGTMEDPFGHVWTISTHVEDVSAEEMERRKAAAGK